MRAPTKDEEYTERLRLWGSVDEETLRALVGSKHLQPRGSNRTNPWSLYAKELGIPVEMFYKYIRGAKLPPLTVCKKIYRDCVTWTSDYIARMDPDTGTD